MIDDDDLPQPPQVPQLDPISRAMRELADRVSIPLHMIVPPDRGGVNCAGAPVRCWPFGD